MPTVIKTLEYGFPSRDTLLANNTIADLTSINIHVPEAVKTFLSVIVKITFCDVISATGGTITTKAVRLAFNGVAAETITNTTTITNSGENISGVMVQDFTSYFNTNWGAVTNRDTLVGLQINQTTGTTLGVINISATIEITYSCTEENTNIKTVRIPLNAPVGTLATTATTYDTLPILNTYLPEASKTYRNAFIVVQGNQNAGTASTDHTLTLRLGALSHTSGLYERALASDVYFRYVWDLTTDIASIATATQTWQPTNSIARHNHIQAYLVVTYTFDEAASTRIMNSLMLPLGTNSPMGGTTSSDSQTSTNEIWIEEENITVASCAFFVFWTAIVAMNNLNMRVFSNYSPGSFVTYTDATSVLCGSDAAMIRNDSITLNRGLNTLTFEAYRTLSTQYGWDVSGFWILNYTSDKSTQGSSAHNKTVLLNVTQHGTDALIAEEIISGVSLGIPETDYFLNSVGIRLITFTSGGTALNGVVVKVERLTTDDSLAPIRAWENAYTSIQQGDPEVGIFYSWNELKDIFKKYPGQVDHPRLDIETARRWKIYAPTTAANTAMALLSLTILVTYHSIVFPVAGDIVGSFPGSKDVKLIREDPPGTLKKLTLLSSDTEFSFNWFDNTNPVFVKLNNGDGTNHYSQVRLASASNDFSVQRVTPYSPPGDGETLTVLHVAHEEVYGQNINVTIPTVPVGSSAIVSFFLEPGRTSSVTDNGTGTTTYTEDLILPGLYTNDVRFYSKSNITNEPTQISINLSEASLTHYTILIVDGPIVCHDTDGDRVEVSSSTSISVPVTTPVDNCLVLAIFNTTGATNLTGLGGVVTIPGPATSAYNPSAYRENIGIAGSYNLSFSSSPAAGGSVVVVPYSIDLGTPPPPPPPPPASGDPTYYSY